MNVKELREILQTEKVNPYYYSLSTAEPVTVEIVFCLHEQKNGYMVYVSNRGQMEDKQDFTDEHTACVAFLKLMWGYEPEKLKKYLPAE